MDRTILIVDDDKSLCGILSRFLGNHGFASISAHDVASARSILDAQRPDLVLMDINLPDGSGFDYTREIRDGSHGDIPIIMLTGRHSEIDVVIGFDQGADDYIAKPFRTAELLARIQAVLRRAEIPQTAAPGPAEPQTRTSRALFGPWSLDLETRSLSGRDASIVQLTRAEFDLLAYLLKTAGRMVPRERLMAALIADDDIGDQAIEARIYRLRKKIESDPGNPKLLVTRRGEGYLFTPEVAWA